MINEHVKNNFVIKNEGKLMCFAGLGNKKKYFAIVDHLLMGEKTVFHLREWHKKKLSRVFLQLTSETVI